MRLFKAKNRTPRRGTHTVEFALAFPIFATFLLGLIEVGRGFMVAGLLSNAAQAGCRAGVVPSATTSTVTTAVDSYLSGIGVSGYSTSVLVGGASASPSTASTGTAITVTVTVPVANVSWLPGSNYLSGNLKGQFTLPHE
ncbi:MAG: TadE/TadG family type IV pilus assembly protein [Gemmataceae bacterium]